MHLLNRMQSLQVNGQFPHIALLKPLSDARTSDGSGIDPSCSGCCLLVGSGGEVIGTPFHRPGNQGAGSFSAHPWFPVLEGSALALHRHPCTCREISFESRLHGLQVVSVEGGAVWK